MNTKRFWIPMLLALMILPVAILAHDKKGIDFDVVVDGCARPEYHARGKVYVEAVRGKEYALRITNPFPHRVAVALSVDGLNTINAKHTSARKASKWVLGPYETVVISGWQMDGKTARKFYFTGEKDSYGALLGETQNLGVIEAVFFKEKTCRPPKTVQQPRCEEKKHREGGRSGDSSKSRSAPSMESEAPVGLADDFAATGIGEETNHEVQWVNMKLEKKPCVTLKIRYEFRPQLVRLGVLPKPPCTPDPIIRREGAEGFEQSYCPNPYSKRR